MNRSSREYWAYMKQMRPRISVSSRPSHICIALGLEEENWSTTPFCIRKFVGEVARQGGEMGDDGSERRKRRGRHGC